MNIIEKLGILPIESYLVIGPMDLKYEIYHTKEVRQIEQQNNEMLEALIKVQEYFDITFPPEKYGDNAGKRSEEEPKIVDKIIRAVEKTDFQNRTWDEIKELL